MTPTTAFACDEVAEPPSRRRVLLRAAALSAVALAAAFAAVAAAGTLAPSPPAAPQGPFSVGVHEAGGQAGGVVGWLLARQAAFYQELSASVDGIASGTGGAAALVGVAFLYGLFHAAGPGHGKAVIAAWMFANERALRRGLWICAGAAMLQGLVAVALVGALGGILRLTADGITHATGIVEAGAMAAVAAVGAALLWRRALGLADRPHAHGAGCACAPPRPADGAGGILPAVLAAGARPCSGAIIVLALALSRHAFPAGVAATAAMSAGTALATAALACLAVRAKRAALAMAASRGPAAGRALAAAECLAAALVCALGVCLLAASLAGRGGGA